MQLANLFDGHSLGFRQSRQVFAIVANRNFLGRHFGQFFVCDDLETLQEFVGQSHRFRSNVRIEFQQNLREGRHIFDQSSRRVPLQFGHHGALAGEGLVSEPLGELKQQRARAVGNPVHGSPGE